MKREQGEHVKLRLGSWELHRHFTWAVPGEGESWRGRVGVQKTATAVGMHGTRGQGTGLSWTQARFAKAVDRRGLKCFSLTLG